MLILNVQWMTSISRSVVVTGIGLVTPLGLTVNEVWKRLIEGACGITKLEDEKFRNLPCRIAGQVPATFDCTKVLNSASTRNLSRGTMFALVAADMAIQDSKLLPLNPELSARTGVAIGMGMTDMEYIYESGKLLEAKGSGKLSPYFIPRILTNMAAGHISIKYGLMGPNHSVSTACTTGAHSVGDAFRMIKYDDADVMVCGSAEACIYPLAIAGFARARALATKFNDVPEKASRPFDSKREGFVMGEGAGVLVLEEMEHAKKRGAKIYAEILGYGMSGDAHHITAPSEDGRGARLAMQAALRTARVDPMHVQYVNAHATSTPLGDAVENRAIKEVFGNRKDLKVSSCKGALGHLQGGAGSVETILTVLSCYNGIYPPTLNIESLSEEFTLDYVPNEAKMWTCGGRKIALKNSFGFGGTNASLCIGSV